MQGLVFTNIHNVKVFQKRAALGARMVATLVDMVVIFTYWGLVLIFPPTRDLIMGSTSFAILFFLPIFLYHLLCESLFHGKSVGKYLMGTRVMRTDGSSPTVGDYLLRWILRPLDMLFAWSIGILSIIFTSKGQRVGDIAAGTTVVMDAKPKPIREWWKSSPESIGVRFQEAEALSDRDVALLREALDRSRTSKEPLKRLIGRIKERTGLQSNSNEMELAKILIEDHDKLFRKS